MSDPTLDEDGRCKITELLPDQCACENHRNVGNEKEQAVMIEARYDSRCSGCGKHIHAGDMIFKKHEQWVCSIEEVE